MLEDAQPRSLRACSRDDPECGARRGVLRRRLVTVRLGRLGTPPSRHYDLGARSSLHGSARQLPAVVGRRAPKETEARPREPKTATVERREASVPRHGKCSLPSTPYDSTAVWIIPRIIVLLQHSAVLRSMVLHSYIPDTHRTLDPD